MTQYKKVTGDYINNIEDFINDVLMTDELPGSQKRNLFRTGVRVDYLPGSKKTNTIITPSGKVAIILKLEDENTLYSITDPFKNTDLMNVSIDPGSMLAKDASDRDDNPNSQRLILAKRNDEGFLEFEPKVIHRDGVSVYFTSEMDYSYSLDVDYSVYKLSLAGFNAIDKTLMVLDPMQSIRLQIHEMEVSDTFSLEYLEIGGEEINTLPTPLIYGTPEGGRIINIDLLEHYDKFLNGKIKLKVKVESGDRKYFTVRIW